MSTCNLKAFGSISYRNDQSETRLLNGTAKATLLFIFSWAFAFQDIATAQDVEQNNYFASSLFVGLTPSDPITFQAPLGGAIQASFRYTGPAHQPCQPWLMLKAPSGKVLALSSGDNAIPAAASNLKEEGTYSLIGLNANLNAFLNSKVACPFDIQLITVPGNANQTGIWLSPRPPTQLTSATVSVSGLQNAKALTADQPSGSVLKTGDIHQWKFNVAKNDQISLLLKIDGPPYFGPYVYVVDPDGGYVAGQWGAPYANFKANKSGVYTAIVLNTQFDRLLSGHYSVLLSGVSASSLVEFGGPDVKVQNLWLRKTNPPVHLAKSAVVFCQSGNQTIHLPDYLSARSIKSPLIWSATDTEILDAGTISLACPFLNSASIATVTATNAIDPTMSDTISIIVLPQSTRDEFDDWFRRESSDEGWFAELPCAYPKIVIDQDGNPQNPNPVLWDDPISSGLNWPNNYHPGAKYEMRSLGTKNGHGHQAVYDDQGILITDTNCPVNVPDGFPCASAGSVDRSSPISSRVAHKGTDVRPFIWAVQLDGNPVEGTFEDSDLTKPLTLIGEHLKQYLQVRPTVPTPPGLCSLH